MRSPLAFAGLFLFSPIARCDSLCQSGNQPATPTDWESSFPVATFDPSVGRLTAVRVTLSWNETGSVALENRERSPVFVMSTLLSGAVLELQDGTSLVRCSAGASFNDPLDQFDGTVDFSGPSGVTHSGISGSGSSERVLTEVADLALFTGAGSSLPVRLRATGFGSADGSNNLVSVFQQDVGASFEVCFEYTPHVVTVCAGDGSATACPCGNESAPGSGQGCANSTGLGARLVSHGFPSVSQDTFVLESGNLTGTSALFFQGTHLASGGAGSAFGDGLRCAAGTIVRLGIQTVGAATAIYPGSGDPSISARGNVTAAGMRSYQVWYRNSASFCTSSTFNLSNALSVDWQP